MSVEAGATKLSMGLAAHDHDEPLLDRILAGDARAFEELVHRHERRVYRVALAIIGNHEDAEEAIQQTFLKVYQNLSGFQRESRFTTWLTRIAVNEALQIRRRRRTLQPLDKLTSTDEEITPKQLQDWHDDPEKLYSKQEMREIVEDAIQSLRTLYREAFVLCDVQGLTREEAAKALGLSVPTLKSRLLRARLKMREMLAPHFQRPQTFKSRLSQARWKIQDAMMEALIRVSGKERKT